MRLLGKETVPTPSLDGACRGKRGCLASPQPRHLGVLGPVPPTCCTTGAPSPLPYEDNRAFSSHCRGSQGTAPPGHQSLTWVTLLQTSVPSCWGLLQQTATRALEAPACPPAAPAPSRPPQDRGRCPPAAVGPGRGRGRVVRDVRAGARARATRVAGGGAGRPHCAQGCVLSSWGAAWGWPAGAHSGGLPLGPGPVLWVGIRVLLGYPFPRDSPWVSRPTPQGFHAHNSEKRLDLRGAKEGSGTERRPR